MKELDFHPNSLARSLASGLCGAIGVVVDARDAEAFSNFFFSRSLFAIEQVAQEKGYQVIIANGAQSKGKTIENLMKERKVDGLILPPTTVNSSLMETIGDFPYVVLGTPDTLRGDTCWVDNNNEQGSDLAVRHLQDQGYQRIAYLGGNQKRGFTIRRVRGYKKAITGEELVIPTDGTTENAYSAALEILEQKDHPDAFVCNDNMAAFGLLKACKKLKINIPSDVGIPSGTKIVGNWAFSACSHLKSVSIPDGVTELGDGAFFNCTGLKKIDIPEGVTSIGVRCFYMKDGSATITIPDSVSYIAEDAFAIHDGKQYRPNLNLTLIVGKNTYAEKFCESAGLKYQYRD